ncbi:Polysaccharide pyruvyl transferase family protein WcaK [Rathayibacter oskolensis]|uniref:Polysaccharide pyruvyl transferase family protein WcaK n=1 Tax=Rathayibacter oskolensis TaxID=1891671 RepID=A0A1X7NAV9_9MICO|nr:polysaccharide pyruvyl transferase family protein [Rathayibacter oskolensis]SMH34740.1 Polysaccharide pyruvyl transferase family protein WcaK [Rathayibacter oskolensis]
MRITLVHAYSSTNSGDGLLVEEAAGLVRDAFPTAVITLVATDPQSFDGNRFAAVLHPATGGSSGVSRVEALLRGAALVATGRRAAPLEAIIAGSDLVVAVGGGYLRGKSPVEAAKMIFAHYLQMPRAKDRTPFIYLPQSIGPLRFGSKRLVAARLRNATLVVGRDDRTVAELASDNVIRRPDMALLGLPSEWDASGVVAPSNGTPIGLVARELSSTPARIRRYRSRIGQLAVSPGFELLAQATARGNDDPSFYRTLGFDAPVRTLRAAVARESESRPQVVVSVRLHGSIQTIRSGVPSIHLSYERKGFGAYDDLGISKYVHNVFDFEPDLILSQVAELTEDPSEYWSSVGKAVGSLAEARADLVERLRRAVG